MTKEFIIYLSNLSNYRLKAHSLYECIIKATLTAIDEGMGNKVESITDTETMLSYKDIALSATYKTKI